VVRDRAAAAAVAATLPTRHHIAIADVTDGDALRAACASAAAALGPVGILVNNAGHVQTIPFLKATPQDFTAMFAVHAMPIVHTAQAVLPTMVARKHGRIVNVASVAGLMGAPYVAHYVAAKHAAVGLTRALAAEFAGTGVTANAVCPAYVDTEMVHDSVARIAAKTGRGAAETLAAILADAQQPRLVRPQEVADAVLAFCQPDAARSGDTTLLMGLDS
jgi:NAD(P)-dependent dehydrogenase (short-subunit alcohol dehydrogenase family)